MTDEVLRVPGRIGDLEEAFRTGTGMHQPYHWVEGRSDGTRSMFLKLLGSEWLPAVPELHERLSSAPPARIADVGVGSGWSSIAMARAYPDVLVDGYDLDELAIGYAQKHARDAGLGDRVTFLAGDVTKFDTSGRYDLVTIFEALHDLSQPVAVLAPAPRDARRGRHRPGRRRAGAGPDRCPGPRPRPGALRLERAQLPSRSDDRSGLCRNRRRDAHRHASPVCRRGRILRGRRPPNRARWDLAAGYFTPLGA